MPIDRSNDLICGKFTRPQDSACEYLNGAFYYTVIFESPFCTFVLQSLKSAHSVVMDVQPTYSIDTDIRESRTSDFLVRFVIFCGFGCQGPFLVLLAVGDVQQ